MAERVPPEVFYDRSIVGWTATQEEEGGIGWEIPPDRFHRLKPTGDHGNLRALLTRMAAEPYRFGALLLGLGFFAVFIKQAPIHIQIVFGAPVFEEFFKFGLALILAQWMRFLVFRYLVAFAVGAGFGVLEHYVTYADEPMALFWGRVAFHGGTAALSMVSWQALEHLADVRARWAATLLATVIHYLNNSFAVVSIVPSLALPGVVGPFSLAVAASLTACVYITTVWLLFARPRFAGWVEAKVAAVKV